MHARNFTTNVPKILDLKSSSEQIFFRKLSLGAPAPITCIHYMHTSEIPGELSSHANTISSHVTIKCFFLYCKHCLVSKN